MESVFYIKANVLNAISVDFAQLSTHITGYLIINIPSSIEALDWTYNPELRQ